MGNTVKQIHCFFLYIFVSIFHLFKILFPLFINVPYISYDIMIYERQIETFINWEIIKNDPVSQVSPPKEDVDREKTFSSKVLLQVIICPYFSCLS